MIAAALRQPSRTRTRLAELALLAIAALLLLWPAVLNRAVFIAPDALGYISMGHRVLLAALHPIAHPMDEYGRSELFTGLLYFAHFDRTLWPTAFFNALYAVFLIRITLRCLCGSTVTPTIFLAIIAVLSLFTALSWFSCVPLADIYGGPAYLGLFLLSTKLPALTRAERIIIPLLTAWAISSHASHLLVACAVVAVLALIAALPQSPASWRGIRLAACTILASILAQMLFHTLIYGRFVLNANEPPQLMDRLQEDGPAVTYLQQHCPHLNWAICRHVAELPESFDKFLFDPTAVWRSSSPADRRELLREQRPLLIGTVREFPRRQLSISAHQVVAQLTRNSLSDFAEAPYDIEALPRDIPSQLAAHSQSRQALGTLPIARITRINQLFLDASLLATVPLLILTWHRRRKSLLAFAAVVATALLTNAVVCTLFAIVDARYETRILWLVPLLTIALLLNTIGPEPTAGGAR